MSPLERMGVRCDLASSEADGAWKVLAAMERPLPSSVMDVVERLERRASRRQKAWTRLLLAQRRVSS